MKHFYTDIPGWFDYKELYSRMVNLFPTNSHFVEIGSYHGRSVAYMIVEIINSGKKIKFDAIDLWPIGDIVRSKQNNKIIQDNENLYIKFLQNLWNFLEYVTPIKMDSAEAVVLYEDKSLDFVFIDAGHEYKSVMRDLVAWYPKVKINGVFAGHDYDYQGQDGEGGVQKAVNDFFNKKVINIENTCWIHKKIDT